MEQKSVEDTDEFVQQEVHQQKAGQKRKHEESDGEDQVPDQPSSSSSQGNSLVVAQHYNQIEERGLVERKNSTIFFLRNFNNWIKR
jgi:mRNA (guanine-N7-)-methyltransferase